jgi:hypothetical protein
MPGSRAVVAGEMFWRRTVDVCLGWRERRHLPVKWRQTDRRPILSIRVCFQLNCGPVPPHRWLQSFEDLNLKKYRCFIAFVSKVD